MSAPRLDVQTLGRVLRPLTVEWPNAAFDRSRLIQWHKSLARYTEPEIAHVVEWWIENKKYFPKISELREAIQFNRNQPAGDGKAPATYNSHDFTTSVLRSERLLEAMLHGHGVQRTDGVYQEQLILEESRDTYLFDVRRVAQLATKATLSWRDQHQPKATPEQVIERGYAQVTHMARQAAERATGRAA